MMRSMSSRRGLFRLGRRGGAAVELAVAFPILLLLLVGIIDYGRVFYTAVTVSNAARAGAEFGSRDFGAPQDTAEMKVFAQQDGNEAGTLTLSARSYCECGFGNPNPSCSFCGSEAPDVFVEVTASKVVNFLLPYPGLPSSFSITRKATFRTQ